MSVLRSETRGGCSKTGRRWSKALVDLLSCSTEWTYRRIVCPACAEADKEKLPVYKAEDIGYVRVEACDCCRCYLKSVDLTINGLAVPVVDELATVAAISGRKKADM